MSVVFTACVADRYVIGTFGRGSGGSSGLDGGAGDGTAGAGGIPAASTCTPQNMCRLAVDLDRTGVSNVSDTLMLPSGSLTASFRYRGESATGVSWPAERGQTLARGVGIPQTRLEAPFTDSTRAVGLPVDAPAYTATSAEPGSVATDDFVLEVVLRAAPDAPIASKGVAGSSWSLATNTAGELVLALADANRAVTVSSGPLAARAWYHCLFWVSRDAGARADCNGRVGSAVDVAGLGTLGVGSNLTIGGAGAAGLERVQLALLQLFAGSAGQLGSAVSWHSVARRRFAELTGIFPVLARGAALPAEGLRDSLAYLDLQREAGGVRRLFLVGPDWPRIVCRTDVAGAHDCGYLTEPERGRAVPQAPAMWTASEVALSPGNVVFADGSQRMDALIASAASARHGLIRQGSFGGVSQTLSFFVHADASHLVGASVAGLGLAVFDVTAGTVVSAPANVKATIEPWGDGIFRCAYIFTPPGGTIEYRVVLLNDAGAEMFSGDGLTIGAHVAGLQLDPGQTSPGSLLAVSPQAAERLTYVANDGNLPVLGLTSVQLRVLVPTGHRFGDQAILNVNKDSSWDDQINLFLASQAAAIRNGNFEYWGKSAGATHWNYQHSVQASDGLRHSVRVEWGGVGGRSSIWVDGVGKSMAASNVGAAIYQMDRIDVGFSLNSSGHLRGMVAGLQIRGP